MSAIINSSIQRLMSIIGHLELKFLIHNILGLSQGGINLDCGTKNLSAGFASKLQITE